MSWYSFRPYVSVAARRIKAQREMAKLAKKGQTIRPVTIGGRTIAHSFWGKSWCDNLESYMDYENRLPRGRTYVRNGSVVHLDIFPGKIEAIVSGSELYRINIDITPAAQKKWQALCRECAGGIGSLVELLQGRFSDSVMNVITRRETGLFPSPQEIKLKCSCPDWANMCKHVAAVLYGVGARLDENPELLFVLRSVNHADLLTHAATATDLAAKTATAGAELAESEIGAVFGIELDTETNSAPVPTPTAESVPAKPAVRKKTKPASILPAKLGGKAKKKAAKTKPVKSKKTLKSRFP
ncbi:MAG: SWIM zinc finger family protein [Verrucomicrobiota bacterium]